ncbi:MAG: alpha/beta hydrolase-fold protein [Deltaproteobacteria bacterium]
MDVLAADGDAEVPDAGDIAITFVVTVPAGTPRFDSIDLTGNVAELGSWSGQGLVLTRNVSDGTYSATHTFVAGTDLEFKVTRASLETVEKALDGSELPNRTLHVDHTMRVDISVAAWRDRPMLTGNIESLGAFHSLFLADRPLWVYLPPTYEMDTSRRFPVLYMHDGQNLFDARTAFGGVEWGVDETAERLITAGSATPLIIVAIGNTASRMDEYTPSVDATVGGGGSADLYARLIVEELKPMIDARYRTLTDADHTGIAGSSLGGLVSMYFGLVRSSVFHRIGVVSPSVWWDNRAIVLRVSALPAMLPLTIWEDVGTAEGSGAATVADARMLRDALVARGWSLGGNLSYREYVGAMHNETAWAARSGDLLQYLFPP